MLCERTLITGLWRFPERCDTVDTRATYLVHMNHTFATTVALAGLLVGCAATASTSDSDTTSGSFESLKLPSSLQPNEFDAPLTKASIQGLQLSLIHI